MPEAADAREIRVACTDFCPLGARKSVQEFAPSGQDNGLRDARTPRSRETGTKTHGSVGTVPVGPLSSGASTSAPGRGRALGRAGPGRAAGGVDRQWASGYQPRPRGQQAGTHRTGRRRRRDATGRPTQAPANRRRLCSFPARVGRPGLAPGEDAAPAANANGRSRSSVRPVVTVGSWRPRNGPRLPATAGKSLRRADDAAL